MKAASDLAERKARLIAQSDLQRMQAMLAWHSARRIIAPPRAADRSPMARSIATTLIGMALPLLGPGRMRGILRTFSIAATGLRLFRSWRAR